MKRSTRWTEQDVLSAFGYRDGEIANSNAIQCGQRALDAAPHIRLTSPRVPVPLEHDIQTAIIERLCYEPGVWLIKRLNSAVTYQSYKRKDGTEKKRKVECVRLVALWSPIALTAQPKQLDIEVYDLRGVSMIEIKRPGEKPDSGQWAMIQGAKAHGTRAGYATSIEEAVAIVRGER